MDEFTVFAKTPRGIAEVAVRGGSLSLMARRVLIMIDGRRTVTDLAPLLQPGEIEAVITLLENQGFVQRVGPGAPATLMPQTLVPRGVRGIDTAGLLDDTADGEERTLMTLDEARRRAVRELNDRLGPDAETMSIRIEQCQSADELRDRLREAERLVAGFLGEAAAQDFVRALRRR
jgi:hypothetical protein